MSGRERRVSGRVVLSACHFRLPDGVGVGSGLRAGGGVDAVVGIDEFLGSAGGHRAAVDITQLVGAAGGDRHPGAFSEFSGHCDGGLGVAVPVGGHQPVVERGQLRIGAAGGAGGVEQSQPQRCWTFLGDRPPGWVIVPDDQVEGVIPA